MLKLHQNSIKNTSQMQIDLMYFLRQREMSIRCRFDMHCKFGINVFRLIKLCLYYNTLCRYFGDQKGINLWMSNGRQKDIKSVCISDMFFDVIFDVKLPAG